MSGKIENFLRDFGGFIVGSLVGILVICLNIIDTIIAILVVLAFGFLGSYVQKNKSKVKEVLKNLIEKW